MIGPWCFLYRFGPVSFTEGRPMDVAPHPHIGLQTVSWLLEGEVVHDDSLGQEAVLRPGGVNVMTSGHAHCARGADARLTTRAAERCAALDCASRSRPPWRAVVSTSRRRAGSSHRVDRSSVFWACLPADRPSQHFSDLVGADLQILRGDALDVPLIRLRPRTARPLRRLLARRAAARRATSSTTSARTRGDPSRATRRATPAHRRPAVPGDDPHVVELRRAHARGDPRRAERLGEWAALRRREAVRDNRLHAPELVRLARPNPVS